MRLAAAVSKTSGYWGGASGVAQGSYQHAPETVQVVGIIVTIRLMLMTVMMLPVDGDDEDEEVGEVTYKYP